MTMKSNLMLGCGLLMASAATPALSDDTASVSVIRPDTQTVAVDAKSLVRVGVYENAVTRLEFPKNEAFETVVFSDTENWLIELTKNMLFVRPKKAAGAGNMHVITKTAAGETYTYQFELRTRKTGIAMKDDGYVIRLAHSQKGAAS